MRPLSCWLATLALMLFDWAEEPPAAGVGYALLLHLIARGGGWAGYFEGNVYVTGRVTQAGAAASTTQAQDGSARGGDDSPGHGK